MTWTGFSRGPGGEGPEPDTLGTDWTWMAIDCLRREPEATRRATHLLVWGQIGGLRVTETQPPNSLGRPGAPLVSGLCDMLLRISTCPRSYLSISVGLILAFCVWEGTQLCRAPGLSQPSADSVHTYNVREAPDLLGPRPSLDPSLWWEVAF